MDLESLKTFVAIHESGGFSSAAARLHRTQPAISRRVAQLQDSLGVPLFERRGAGVALTEAGRMLLPHARHTLAAAADCRSAMADLAAGRAGRVSLAAVGTLAGAGLAPVLRAFAAAHPQVALNLRTATSTEVSELVRSGEVSVGLRYHTDPAADLDCQAVVAEPLRIVCGPDHPLAGRRLGSLRRLAGEHWLLFPNARRLPDTAADNLLARFQVLGVAELSTTAVDSLTAQKRLVEAGYGLAVLPDSAIVEECAAGRLRIIPVRGVELANPVVAVTRRGGYLSPAASTLLSLVRRGR